MRVITAPGVEITEIDKSQYSPAMTGTTCYIAGFADKGEPYQPMEFTSRAAWTNYYGEPSTEAEKYFYNACVEVLNQNGRLYCARLPYDNDTLDKLVGYQYTVETDKELPSEFKEINAADSTINCVSEIKGSGNPIMYDLDKVNLYRNNEEKPGSGKIIIIDKSCATYGKIPEDTRKGQRCEMIGIMPVITTAANALYAQKLISVEAQNAKNYEVIGQCMTLKTDNFDPNTISSGNCASAINTDLVKQLNSSYKNYYQLSTSIDIKDITDMHDLINNQQKIIDCLLTTELSSSGLQQLTSYGFSVTTDNDDQMFVTYTNESDFDKELYNTTISSMVITFNSNLSTLISAISKSSLSDDTSELSSFETLLTSDKVEDFANKITKLYSYLDKFNEFIAEDGDNSLPTTVSFTANEYFSTIEFDPENNIFKRNKLKDIGVVVFKLYVDAAEGNKISFEPIEAYCGSLQKDEKDPDTGASKFIDDIVNSNSDYIDFFSNCYNTSTTKSFYYDNLDMHIVTPRSNTGILGYYSAQTEKSIAIDTSIYNGLNKAFDLVSDINERDIDIVCDAGVSNIASFIKAAYKDANFGLFDLNQADENGNMLVKSWKCEKSSDVSLKTWKTVVQKYDNFCKNVRKDCMFITECPRPLVIEGQKKIVRPSMPTHSIDVNILPYIKLITGLNTNYGAGYMDWFEIADEYSGDFFWLPPSIKAMGVYINTDVNYNYWDAPAGLNRGKVSATDVAFSPTSKQAGSIYEKCWNYAINYPSDGIVLEGQKTFQVAASAFDRVNVRRLFLRLERQAYKVARYFVYEGNTAYTRQRLVDALDVYFKEAKIGRGIYDYKIICDESVNTPEVIDRNELKVKIGIKPVKTAEFILIDFIALSTSGSFEEAMG